MGLGALAMLVVTNPVVMTQVLGVLSPRRAAVAVLGRRVRSLSRASQTASPTRKRHRSPRCSTRSRSQSYHPARQARRSGRRDRERVRDRGAAQPLRAALVAVHHHRDLRRAAVGLYQGTQAVIAGKITAGHLGQTSGLRDPARVLGGGARPRCTGDLLCRGRDRAPDGAAVGALPGRRRSGAAGRAAGGARRLVGAPRWGGLHTTASRPQRAALDDVTLDVRAGETVAIVDSSGAGKTTLLPTLLLQLLRRRSAAACRSTACRCATRRSPTCGSASASCRRSR